jgi:succinate dehydrogenase / fumarate reductase cytochrome b subunit
MTQPTVTRQRPLSPHLSVYKPVITMTMSIVHRITGGALYFGTLLLAAWLISAAVGEECFNAVNAVFGSWTTVVFSVIATILVWVVAYSVR